MADVTPVRLEELFPKSKPKKWKRKNREELLNINLNKCSICEDKMFEDNERYDWIEENKNNEEWGVVNFAGKKALINEPKGWLLTCSKCLEEMKITKEIKNMQFNSHTVLRIKKKIDKIEKKKEKKYYKDLAENPIYAQDVRTWIHDNIEESLEFHNRLIHLVEPTLEIKLKQKDWIDLMTRVITKDLEETMQDIYKLKRDLDNILKKFHDSLEVAEEQRVNEIAIRTILKKIEDFRDDEYPGHHVHLVQYTEKDLEYSLKLLKSDDPIKIKTSHKSSIPHKMLWDDE
jgi:hypothetical protein